ncbi:non-glycosylated envelope protein [Kibale red colobus virus 1]|uniref:Non-glycosylated envelope protein n=1 Tax=Kibale red colobus virus 1 TaxID=1885929 RepID=X2D5C0_9NIDO|nr:non-glycosylated envelope protein [Kibale red colobus virus 1]AHH53611.1 non-glycosylated envelope protein [Kibale red colobus virus 1]AHH53863.1 non-glycosylated envelope protein [Kibale red colobus virus 1]
MVSKICSDPGYTTLAFTMGPVCIALLRLFRPSIRGIVCLLCIFCLAYAATAFSTHSLATIVTIAFALIYLAYSFTRWLVVRCRLCRVGPRYMFSPSSFIESSLGRIAIPDSTTGLVSRRPGTTLANGKLVPDVKMMVLAGKVAAKKGLVHLRKYGWQTKTK